MNISEIVIGERVRKEMGNLDSLAESIKTQGLLQPIGITESKVLVFGERRLKACRDILGWTEIPAKVVNVTSILAGEYAENTVRKDFTPSERVAIAEAVRKEIGNRQGKRTDQPLPQHVAEVPLTGRETRQIAAERSGLGSHATYNYARRVVDKGTPELVQAMDEGKVSIRAAGTVAALPVEVQRQALKEGRVIEVARGPRRDRTSNSMSRKAQYKHPALKLENIATTLETVAEAVASLDPRLTAEIPSDKMASWVNRIEQAMRETRAGLTRLTRQAV